MINYTYNKLTPFKWFVLENFPFIEADFDALTDWQLFCKLGKEINKIINSVNLSGEQVEKLTNAFNDLQNYVNNYFDNLDLQEEVNRKLNEMVEDGTFDKLIAKYINNNITHCFTTCLEMKKANLPINSIVKTLGYYEKNDNGSASYFITDTKSNNKFYENLENGLFAELIINDTMNIKSFGIKENDVDDDTDLLQTIINLAPFNNFEIKGNRQPLIISKSITIPNNCKINNIYFKTRTNNFTKNFMIGINTTNFENWEQSHPNSTFGYFKNCTIENENTENMINGIYNFANNHFENVYFNKLNVAFKIDSNYLDKVIMYNFAIARKIGTDYALDLGYLGDGCELNQVHMYETIGSQKFINVGGGHNPINIQNLIGKGLIYIKDSQVNILNIHNESTENVQIEINHGTVNIENGFFFHNKPSIFIDNNSNVVIKNTLFEYELYKYSYDKLDDIDININDARSVLTLINTYKSLRKESAINIKVLNSVLTNLDTMPSLRNIKSYNNQSNAIINNLDDFLNKSLSVAYAQKSDYVKWFQASDTYFYKIVPIFDNIRMISSNYSNTASINLLQNNEGFRFAAATSSTWRIYRGLSENNYDVYCDIANISKSINDNGYFVNGFKWKERTPGDIDNFNKNFTYIRHLNNNNVECMCRELPEFGFWNVGDIIHKLNNNVYETYVCTVAGTPGTWVKQT